MTYDEVRQMVLDGKVSAEFVDPRPGHNERRIAIHVGHNGKTKTEYINWTLETADHRGDLVRVAPMLLNIVRFNLDKLDEESQITARSILAEFADPSRKVQPEVAIRNTIVFAVEQAILDCCEVHDKELCLDCPDTGVLNELRITDSRTKEAEDEPNP